MHLLGQLIEKQQASASGLLDQGAHGAGEGIGSVEALVGLDWLGLEWIGIGSFGRRDYDMGHDSF